jgi:uncharacterized membrane protein
MKKITIIGGIIAGLSTTALRYVFIAILTGLSTYPKSHKALENCNGYNTFE